MLQTVVRHNQPDVGMRRQQRPACLRTAAAHCRRRAGFTEQQQRLVARIFRSACGIQYMNRLALAPVAPADDADLDAFFLQTRHQRATIGVFPVPPAWILPTTTTGTGSFSLFRWPETKSSRRFAAILANSLDKGLSRKDKNGLGRCQWRSMIWWSLGIQTAFGVRGGNVWRQAGFIAD